MIEVLVMLWLAAIFIVVLLSIYVYLVWRKINNSLHLKRKRDWLEIHSTAIESYILTGGGAEEFVPVKEYQFEALEDRFSDYLSNFRFDTDFHPIKDFVNRYFVSRYRKQLRHRHWSIRMNTLYFVDLFRINAMREELVQLLQNRKCSPEERYQIFLTLASFNDADMMELMQTSSQMPTFLLTELLARLVQQDNVERFVEEFDRFSASWQHAILDVIRDKSLRCEELQRLLEGLLQSDNSELVVRSLKTLDSLGYITSPDVIMGLFDKYTRNGMWDSPQANVVKLMMVRLMGNIRNEQFRPVLLSLIGDSVYNVRSEVARAIRKYKDGRAMLQSIAASHEDGYARSISQEWLERSLEID